MRVIAHRGYSAVYPENTMTAFRKAVESGADGIELDVHLSSDGEVMVIHDESLKRTTGRDAHVSDLTRSELEKTDAGFIKNGDYGFCPIPSLDEVLEYLSTTNLLLNIELKTAPVYYPHIEEKTEALVRKHHMEAHVIHSSFYWLSVFKMKRIVPDGDFGLLIENPPIANLGWEMHDLDILSYHPAYSLLSDRVVGEMHECGRRINVWTVDDEEKIKKCIDWGIEGLITNDPVKARKVIQNA